MANSQLETAKDIILNTNAVADVFFASEAVDTLYQRIEDWALQAQALIQEGRDEGPNIGAENVMPVSQLLFKIQQVLNTAPMDRFLLALSQDEHLAIRAAAKGNLCERVEQGCDGEMVIMGNCNLHVLHMTEELITEIGHDEDILKGFHDWQRAGADLQALKYDYR